MTEESTNTHLDINSWEEEMITALAKKHEISEEAVMDIGMTFLVNEMESARHHNPCFMTALSTALIKKDIETAKAKNSDND